MQADGSFSGGWRDELSFNSVSSVEPFMDVVES